MRTLLIRDQEGERTHEGVAFAKEEVDFAPSPITRKVVEALVARRESTGEQVGALIFGSDVNLADDGMFSVNGVGGTVSEYTFGQRVETSGPAVWEITTVNPAKEV